MKKLNSLWMLGLLMFAAINFVSCSDDDDAPGSSSDLVGLWELVSAEYKEKDDGETDEWEEFENDRRLKFNADGTGMSYENYDGKWEENEPARWQYKGGKLYITSYDEEYDEEHLEVATVKELSSSRLVIEVHEKGDSWEYWARMTYRKID